MNRRQFIQYASLGFACLWAGENLVAACSKSNTPKLKVNIWRGDQLLETVETEFKCGIPDVILDKCEQHILRETSAQKVRL